MKIFPPDERMQWQKLQGKAMYISTHTKQPFFNEGAGLPTICTPRTESAACEINPQATKKPTGMDRQKKIVVFYANADCVTTKLPSLHLLIKNLGATIVIITETWAYKTGKTAGL